MRWRLGREVKTSLIGNINFRLDSYKTMFRWLGILLYIIFVLVLVCANMALNITRGSTDKFKNPRCVSGTSINCDSLNGAYCVTSKCFECQCDANNPTFYQNGYSDGKCVKNEKLSVSLGDSHSFLANHDDRHLCMEPLSDAVPDLTVDTCDVTNTQQHWIWTKHYQILNLHTLKCLQTSEIPVFRRRYPKVLLASCNASDSKQIWECRGTRGLVYLKYEKAYLNFGNVQTYVIVYNGTGAYSLWKRYQSDRLFCSSVSAYHGCYKYSDGSSMFTIKTDALNKCDDSSDQCEEEKSISAPIEATNHQCSIQWEITEFLNYSQWNYLPERVLDIKSFHLVKRNSKTITLKVNLAASQNLRGQIIKLYIRCESTSYHRHGRLMDQITSIKQGENETHCVLVKFSGNFKSLFPVQLSTTPTASYTAQTRGSMISTLPSPTTGNEAQTRSSFSTKLSTIFMQNETTTHSAGDQTGSSSSTVVIISAVCVTSLLLFATIILFFVFKQRRYRCCMKKAHETRNDLYERNGMQHPSVKSAETLNPVYSCSNIPPSSQREVSGSSDGHELPVDAASSECVLYGSNTNENVYYEPKAIINTSHTASEHTYDYANTLTE